MREAADRTAHHEEEQIAEVPERLFDRAAENPEIDHVAEEMDQAAVKKERGEECDRDLDAVVAEQCGMNKTRRREAEDIDQRFGPRPEEKLQYEDHDVGHDQRTIDHRHHVRRRRLTKRNHASARPISRTTSAI